MKKKRTTKIICIFILLALTAYIVVGFCDTKLELTEYIYHNTKIPSDFDGYRIVQISDLHHKNFGEHQKELLNMIKKAKPDIIVLTGDLIDKNHTDMTSVEDFIKGIIYIAPVYSVTGNHEMDPDACENYAMLIKLFNKYGIYNLDDDSVQINKGKSSICLSGQQYRADYISQTLPIADESKFNILLYHCSDYFNLINEYGYDIIFSGHTHGGIIRLPFVGGIIGNHRNFFPEYDGGTFTEEKCTLFSSRGLGDAKIPRFYNPPEVVCVTLKSN